MANLDAGISAGYVANRQVKHMATRSLIFFPMEATSTTIATHTTNAQPLDNIPPKNPAMLQAKELTSFPAFSTIATATDWKAVSAR